MQIRKYRKILGFSYGLGKRITILQQQGAKHRKLIPLFARRHLAHRDYNLYDLVRKRYGVCMTGTFRDTCGLLVFTSGIYVLHNVMHTP